MLPSARAEADEGAAPGWLLFADPSSAAREVAGALDDAFPTSVVAGGLSCPARAGAPSLWWRDGSGAAAVAGRALPAGALLCLGLRGPNCELHTICAQGATPVGKPFTVTKGDGNIVAELNGESALKALNDVARGVSDDPRLLRLLQSALLVGVAAPDDGGWPFTDDFLIRMVLGATPGGGLAIGDEVTPGQGELQFHVRDAIAADDDLRIQLGRYQLARQFSGRFPPRDERPCAPLAALLFSCNGRGTNMYDDAGHDTARFLEGGLGAPPIGGFFCNGEIGPLGTSGIELDRRTRTHIHGFTSVFALIYDTSAS